MAMDYRKIIKKKKKKKGLMKALMRNSTNQKKGY